jgi:hypothetical protein
MPLGVPACPTEGSKLLIHRCGAGAFACETTCLSTLGQRTNDQRHQVPGDQQRKV